MNWCVLLRTSDLQHFAQSCFYFAYFIEVFCSCRSYSCSPGIRLHTDMTQNGDEYFHSRGVQGSIRSHVSMYLQQLECVILYACHLRIKRINIQNHNRLQPCALEGGGGIFKISAKKVVFTVSSWKKQITPLLAPHRNFWKNPRVPPSEKILPTPMIATLGKDGDGYE